jgi:hypothetical protein
MIDSPELSIAIYFELIRLEFVITACLLHLSGLFTKTLELFLFSLVFD